MSKIIQSGNSLAVTIPKKFAKQLGVKKGDNIRLKKLPHKGELIISFDGPKQLILSENKDEK